MTKRHVVETVEEFNDEGKVVRKTTVETNEEEDNKVNTYGPLTIVYSGKDKDDISADEIMKQIAEKLADQLISTVK